MNRYLYLFLFPALVSCFSHSVSEKALNEYILDEEHGLYKKIDKYNTLIECVYRPSELVWLEELRDINDQSQLLKQQKIIDSLTYFVLKFSRNGKEIESSYVSNSSEFKTVLNYLSFEIYNDIYLINNSDTLHALDATYARTFGASVSTNVLVVFKKNLRAYGNNVIIAFDDPIFGTGMNEFTYKSNDIYNTPNLILK